MENLFSYYYYEASRGAGVQSVTVKPTGCEFDPHSRGWNIYLNLYFQFFALVSGRSAALSSATGHAMPPEFGGKWALLCAGYSVKLIFLSLLVERSSEVCVLCKAWFVL